MKALRTVDLDAADPISLRGPGKRSPDTRASIYIRDAVLVEAAALFCAGMSSNAAAEIIHKKLVRYRAGAWRRHRIEEHLPAELVGKVTELFWHSLKARDVVPAARSIRAVIDAAKKSDRGVFVANGAHHGDGRSNARGR